MSMSCFPVLRADISWVPVAVCILFQSLYVPNSLLWKNVNCMMGVVLSLYHTSLVHADMLYKLVFKVSKFSVLLVRHRNENP